MTKLYFYDFTFYYNKGDYYLSFNFSFVGFIHLVVHKRQGNNQKESQPSLVTLRDQTIDPLVDFSRHFYWREKTQPIWQVFLVMLSDQLEIFSNILMDEEAKD